MNQTQVGIHALKLRVLFFQFLKAFDIAGFHTTIPLFPSCLAAARLKNVTVEMPNSRHRSSAFRPFSCSLIALTIWVSVKRDFFILTHLKLNCFVNFQMSENQGSLQRDTHQLQNSKKQDRSPASFCRVNLSPASCSSAELASVSIHQCKIRND